jgi:hypothetical protein
MEEGKDQERRDRGPFAYENWVLSLRDAPRQMSFEYPLFTDAHITGMVTEGYGPYQFLNTIASVKRGSARKYPAIVLRMNSYLVYDPETDWSRTDESRYHGGLIHDEVAALLSLCLGIRFKAGGYTRIFEPDKDPVGLPVHYSFEDDPVLPETTREYVIPQAVGTHSLDDVAPFKNLAVLSPGEAIALVRAARLYQDGLWIAESEPALSWLMLVSAVETAAHAWKETEETPLERLQASRPELENLLREAGGEQFLLKVAEQIAPYMGATRKFIDFVLAFLPEPPPERPVEWAQHPWDESSMKRSMQMIYKYRSRALHGGTPFPAPMSLPPMSLEGRRIEVPSGATGTKGSVWVARDLPMLLHTFEYIARKALLKWWESMAARRTGQARPASEGIDRSN